MIIKDNFLPEDDFKKFQEKVLSGDFPWYYTPHVSLPPGDHKFKDQFARETDGFNHMIFDREDSNISFFFRHCSVFFEKLEKDYGYTRDNLIRARASMKNPKIGWNEENYNLPHVDYFYPHDTIIYYFNNSDGDTRMFEPVFNGFPEPEIFPTVHRITPMANRLVLFNGLQYHTATNPINSTRRVILNINLDPL
jgi:hypothetical protein